LAELRAEGGVTFMLPDLAQGIAKLQDELRPEDPAMGKGIADWTITAEYRDNLTDDDGSPVWGMCCSPSSLPELKKLQPADMAAKRAHFIIRTPKSASELPEIDRTILHESGHVLLAPLKSTNREAEENAMHSFDFYFSKLSPERGKILARSFQNPMARAYRAETTAMPDPIEEKKEPDKEAPKMQEGGAEMSVEEIKKALAEARLAGDQPKVLELVDKLLVTHMAAPAPASPVAPIEPASMGMKPEEAYMRKAAQNTKEAIEAIIEANPHLDDKQKAMARKQSSAKDARELVSTYPRAANQNEPARLGMPKDVKTNGDANEKPLARAMKAASANPMVRKVLGLGSLDEDGVHFEPGGGILVYTDGTTQLNHQRAVYQARQNKLRGAA
jgi:hypothetical protein